MLRSGSRRWRGNESYSARSPDASVRGTHLQALPGHLVHVSAAMTLVMIHLDLECLMDKGSEADLWAVPLALMTRSHVAQASNFARSAAHELQTMMYTTDATSSGYFVSYKQSARTIARVRARGPGGSCQTAQLRTTLDPDHHTKYRE
jgi:hypothetical protein